MKRRQTLRSGVEILEPRIAPAVTLIPEALGFSPGAPGHSATLKIAIGTLANVDQAEQLFAGTLAAFFTGTDNGVSVINYADNDNTTGGNFGSNRNISAFAGLPAGDNNHYAIRTSGFIQITTPGTYVFGVNSDEGFRLKMGAADAVVAEAAGLKTPSDVAGDVIFPTAGFYRYELTYFEATGGSEVELFARGPGMPSNTLLGSGGLAVVQSGTYSPFAPTPFVEGELEGHLIDVALQNGGFILDLAQAGQVVNGVTSLAVLNSFATSVNFRDFATNPVGGGFAGDTDFHTLPTMPAGDINDMALRARGFLYFPTPGTWTFGLNSDDGASLTIGGTKVINADGPRGGGDILRSVAISQAGYYPYEVLYFERGGGAQLEFFAQGPGDSAPVLVGNTATSGLRAFAVVHYSITGTGGDDDISMIEFSPGMAGVYMNGTYAGQVPTDSTIILSTLAGDDRILVDGTFNSLTVAGGDDHDTVVLSNSASLGNGGFFGGTGVDALDYSGWTTPIFANLSDRHAFTATLSGANEVGPNTSTATGNALLFVTPGTNAMEIFSDVLGIAPAAMTGSHIHSAAPGVNGPVIVNLGTAWAPFGANGALLDVNGTFPAANIGALLGGTTYINVHTAAFPGGMIRGNFTFGGKSNSATGIRILDSVEDAMGGTGGDFIVGRSSGTLSGGGGNDIIAGGLFDDLLDGGTGDDRLFPGLDAVGDTVRGGPGSDTLIERRIAGDATLTNTAFIASGVAAADNPLTGIERALLSGDGGANTFTTTGFTRGPVALVGAEVVKTAEVPGVLSIADAVVATGGPGSGVAMTFTVSLRHALFTPLTFDFKTRDGTAKAPGDFTTTTGTATIPAGAMTAVITIPVEGNTAGEPSEFFNVQLSIPAGQPAKLGDGLARGVIHLPGLAVVNPQTATFRDVDGDIVTVKTTAGEFSPGFFNMRTAGQLAGEILDTLTLPPSFQGAKISISAKRDPLLGGDGAVHVGFIHASGVDFSGITVGGDLATIFAGDGDATTPAIGTLALGSFGVFRSFTQPSVFINESKLTGGLGKLSVRGDFANVLLSTSGGLTAKIGSIFIGGSTRSDFTDASITSDGDIGSIFVKGSLRSTSISTKPGAKIGAVTIGGDVAPGFFTGITSGLTLGAVTIKGGVFGNTSGQMEIAALGGGAPGVPAIKSITIGGSANTLHIHAGLSSFGSALNDASASIGPVKVGGDWIGGNILAGVRAIGGQFDTTPATGTASRIASITIGGSTAGASGFGAPPNAFAAGEIGAIKLRNRVVPLSKLLPDNIALSPVGNIRVIEFA